MERMKEYERCVLHGIEWKSTSVNGNPSYWVSFTDSEGCFHFAYTASDASAGYTASNYRYAENGTPIYLKYHFTRKTGACIVDMIKHNTPEQARKEGNA